MADAVRGFRFADTIARGLAVFSGQTAKLRIDPGAFRIVDIGRAAQKRQEYLPRIGRRRRTVKWGSWRTEELW